MRAAVHVWDGVVPDVCDPLQVEAGVVPGLAVPLHLPYSVPALYAGAQTDAHLASRVKR